MDELQIWIGPLIQAECKALTAWSQGERALNSVDQGAYTRPLYGIEKSFEDRRVLQIDRFESTVSKHQLEARLSDSETFIRASFDKPSIRTHKITTGRSFKEGTVGGLVELNRYTLCFTKSPGKPGCVTLKVQDFNYLGEVGAVTMGQPKKVEEQQHLCESVAALDSIMSRNGSRSPSPVYSQAGDAYAESQDPGISTQYLPPNDDISQSIQSASTNKLPINASTTNADLVRALGIGIRKPVSVQSDKAILQLSKGGTRDSLQHVLQKSSATERNISSPAGTNMILSPGSVNSKQIASSNKPVTTPVLLNSLSSGSEKENSKESRSSRKLTTNSSTLENPTNDDDSDNISRLKALTEGQNVSSECPWQGQQRIPRREFKIPRDQLTILEMDSSWIRSVADLQSSPRIPPAILAEVDRFIDEQANKPTIIGTNSVLPARPSGTPDPTAPQTDVETDWSVTPERGVKRAVDLYTAGSDADSDVEIPMPENSDDEDDMPEDSDEEDEMPGQYSERVSTFKGVSPEVSLPVSGDYKSVPKPISTQGSVKDMEINTVRSHSSRIIGDDDDMDEDDMEFEVPHAIDDDTDMPGNRSAPPSPTTPKSAVQVERTPGRVCVGATEVLSEDKDTRLLDGKTAEVVASSNTIIPGTLNIEMSQSNSELPITAPSVGLDGLTDVKDNDEEIATVQDRLQAESHSSPKPSKSLFKRRSIKAIELDFRQSSQEPVDLKDLARANRHKFIKNLKETTSTGSSKPASQQPIKFPQTPSTFRADSNKIQQSAVVTNATDSTLASIPRRHVSFDELDNVPVSSSSQNNPETPVEDVPDEDSLDKISEKPADQQDQIVEETIFEKFVAVYPSYEGSLRAFVRCAAYLKWLQDTKRGPHKSLYDDMLRVFASVEYSDHIEETKAKGEKPMPLLTFYNETIDTPIYQERIVVPSDLTKVLELDPEEAVKSARAFTERSSRSMHTSRSTSVNSVRIPDHDSLGGIQATREFEDDGPVSIRKPFFETPSQLPSSRQNSTTSAQSARADNQVNESAYEDPGPVYMDDGDDNTSSRSEVIGSSKKRARLPWQSSLPDDAVSSSYAMSVARRGQGGVPSLSESTYPGDKVPQSPSLPAKYTPRSSVQKPGTSNKAPSFSALRSKFLGESPPIQSTTNKPKFHPSRRYTTMLPSNKSLEDDSGSMRAAKRPRHSMPARYSQERIEPATPEEVEFAKLAREFVPKRMSLDDISEETPTPNLGSWRSSGHQSRRYTEPETQDWDI